MTPVLTPAYGRDYKSAKAATAAFLEGKDFMFHHFSRPSTYANITDLRADFDTVNIRYGNMRKVCVVRIPPAAPSVPPETRADRDARRLASVGTVGRILSHKETK